VGVAFEALCNYLPKLGVLILDSIDVVIEPGRAQLGVNSEIISCKLIFNAIFYQWISIFFVNSLLKAFHGFAHSSPFEHEGGYVSVSTLVLFSEGNGPVRKSFPAELSGVYVLMRVKHGGDSCFP